MNGNSNIAKHTKNLFFPKTTKCLGNEECLNMPYGRAKTATQATH